MFLLLPSVTCDLILEATKKKEFLPMDHASQNAAFFGNDPDHEYALKLSADLNSEHKSPAEDTDSDLELALKLQAEFDSESKTTPPPQRSPPRSRSSRPRVPLCCTCASEIRGRCVTAGDLSYCASCFNCTLCNLTLLNARNVRVVEMEAGLRAVHSSCWEEVYAPRCVSCRGVFDGDSGVFRFQKHPFFPDWRYCSPCSNNARCTGCGRVEGPGGWADLGDGRKICHSCGRTAILDSEELRPLWFDVLEFLDKKLGLCVWPEMREVPVLSVGFGALNERGVHGDSNSAVTRGICLSEETTRSQGLQVPALEYDRGTNSYRITTRSLHFEPKTTRSVSAILCLSGLPRDLSASVLAHEAIHAWLKLHPSPPPSAPPLSRQAEEGVCQLVAHLYLQYLRPKTPDPSPDADDVSDDRLRKYFLYSIESDTSEVYGEGFRKAARMFEQIGLEATLSVLTEEGDFV